MKKFDEIFEDKTKYGVKMPTSEYCESGANIIIDQGQDQVSGYTDKEEGIFCEVPAIIFGDHTRIVKYVDKPFFMGADGVKILRSKLPDSNYKYLYYALKHAKIPNTGYNRHFKWLKEIQIKYPEKKQQKEIAYNLDCVCEIIEMRKRQYQKLDELIKSRFVEMFGDPEANPNGYPIKAVSKIAEYWNGLTYKPEDVSGNGTVVLRSSNIQNMQLDFADTVRVSCKIGEKKYVQDNDILMCSRNGSAKLVGKVALIHNLQEPMSFGAFMMIIRSSYYPYLMTYFQLPAFRSQIKTGAATTINQITVKMMDKIMMPIPDMNTVNKFADFVKQVDKSKIAVQKSLEETQNLFDSLMQEYFG